jgi:uncharacterized protein YdeI (YjbR/CyaY-like superfamily)
MKQLPEIYFSTREEWRNWLSINHNTSEGVWMIFHNKKSGLPTLTYDEYVEEALCFGWIDSTLKNIDEKSFRMIASPRKNMMKHYIQWVMSAKQASTQLKRMNEALTLLKNNHKNLMK